MEQTAETTELAEITKRLEYMILKKMLNEFNAKKLDEETFSKHCQEFLAIEPFTSVEDAQAKIGSFVVNNPNYVELDTYIQTYHQEKKTDDIIESMRAHIKNNDFGQALHVAKTQ